MYYEGENQCIHTHVHFLFGGSDITKHTLQQIHCVYDYAGGKKRSH